MPEVVAEDEIIEIQVPPAPIVELHVGSGVVQPNLLKVPLIGRVGSYGTELAKVVADLEARQVAHCAVIAECCAARRRCFGEEREVARSAEERPFVEVDDGGVPQKVGGVY